MSSDFGIMRKLCTEQQEEAKRGPFPAKTNKNHKQPPFSEFMQLPFQQ